MTKTRRLTKKQQRDLVRWAHLLAALPLGALVYAPPEVAMAIRDVLQIAIFPLLTLTGLWLWKGPQLQRWMRNRQNKTTHPDHDPREMRRVRIQ